MKQFVPAHPLNCCRACDCERWLCRVTWTSTGRLSATIVHEFATYVHGVMPSRPSSRVSAGLNRGKVNEMDAGLCRSALRRSRWKASTPKGRHSAQRRSEEVEHPLVIL